MRRVRTYRTVSAPAEDLWALLTDVDAWPSWGPSVRQATLDGDRLGPGATGTVVPAVGPALSFRITSWQEGRSWGWDVAGIAATDHNVEPLGPARCRIGFGAPWVAAPYLAVCRVALARLDELATEG